MSPVDSSLVRKAFIYTLPFAEVYRQFALQVATQGPANRLMAFRGLADASFRNVPSPNTDTLYTVFAYDLTDGPLVVQAPAIPEDRYFVLPFYDAFTNVIASFGTRTGTTHALNLLVTPPGYEGEVPEGFLEVKSPSLIGSMLGRILIDGPEDLEEVRAIQDSVVVEPLAGWKRGERRPLINFARPEPVEGVSFFRTRNDPVDFWKGVGQIVAGTEIPEADAELFDSFAPLGLTREGFVLPEDPDDREVLLTETEASWTFIADFAADQSQAEAQGVSFFNSHGWGWSAAARDADNTGRLDYGTQYLLRAWVNYLYYGMLPPDEALYPAVYADSEGRPLSGEHTYTFTVPSGGRPVRDLGFTSVTLYDMDGYFVDNPENIYKIGDRDKNLALDADGGLTITISADKPAAPVNWLPSPKGERFYLMFRAYLPTEPLLDGSYVFSPVVRVS